MHDMLVRLYELPSLTDAIAAVERRGVIVRRALAPEKRDVIAWVGTHFPSSVAEVEVACARLPITCFVAVRSCHLVGFACYDATCPNFFGPEGVIESDRGQGVGRALLLAALHAQRGQGYGYAIIGGVGPAAFYAKAVGAVSIAGSSPGIYAGILPRNPPAA